MLAEGRRKLRRAVDARVVKAEAGSKKLLPGVVARCFGGRPTRPALAGGSASPKPLSPQEQLPGEQV
jgi:hypothetical protein